MIKTENPVGSRPVDPKTRSPLEPREQPGYYPGFRTMSQRKYWDDATRKVVEDRVANVPPIRFFNDVELLTMSAVADRILPQDDRKAEFRIPIVNAIDSRLFENRIDGYRFEGMPPDGDAYRLGMAAIDRMSQEQHGKPFVDLSSLEQDGILKSLHDAQPNGADEIWDHMSVERFWHMLVQDCVEVYYSHPWAWDEIGYGGPAYPRAYTRLEGGLPEPWEVDEQRYEWEAPANSLSGKTEAPPNEHQSVSGQGGTH